MEFSIVSFLLGVVAGIGALAHLYYKNWKEKTAITQEHLILKAIREEEQKSKEKEKQLFDEGQKQLVSTFQALSSEALNRNNELFFKLAKNTFENFHSNTQTSLAHQQNSIQSVLKPLEEKLKQFQEHINIIEKSRIGAYSALNEQLKGLVNTQVKLESETQNLVKALRTPNVRGQWGEMHLRKTVELAGMINYVDFIEQLSLDGGDTKQRPDMLIRLPNNKTIIVDAKAPLISYLEGIQASDTEQSKTHFLAHAKHIKDHLLKLSSKQYWKQLNPSPEFVILFLPGESFFSSALQHDPSLIEYGVQQKVLLATPTTLIALLKTIAYGWQEDKINKETQIISQLGSDLYERMHIFGEHFFDLRKHLEKTVQAFNKTLGSLETRLLPVARKFNELHIHSSKNIPECSLLEITPVAPKSEELLNRPLD